MKKYFFVFFIIIFCLLLGINEILCVNALSPLTALNDEKLAEEILYQLQNSTSCEDENKDIYSYLEILNNENTLFYNYKISEIETLLQNYKETILKQAKKFANENEYKKAVELLQSKQCLFKDKSTVNSLISYYSKFFIQDGLFYYENEPIVLSIGKLIAYPELAFSETANINCQANLTPTEFQNLLTQLYNENYVLINLDDYINFEQNTVVKKDLYLPQNKKPLILILNDTNYDNQEGFIEKYIVDNQNEIASYNSKATEKNIISYNTDFIPILETFITENKNFSFNNAKAIICVNENEKILGYNINKQNPTQAQDVLNLKKLVQTLKEKGYKFAYNDSLNNLGEEEYNSKLEIFKTDLKQIFGEINLYYYNKSTINSLNFNNLNDFNIKIVFSTIKTNTSISKNNFLIIPTFQITINNLKNPDFPIESLDYDEIFDHINRKTY